MQWLDKQRLKTEFLTGTFLNLGSPSAVEIAASVGFDWFVIDLEHGSGSLADLRNMLLACRESDTAPIVRIRSIDADSAKFVMDSGAAGVMFPFVNSAAKAREAVRMTKYPPAGRRGVAGTIRATDYGRNWQQYFSEANQRGTVVAQIETPEAAENASEIAAVDGVDVLFVGPLDLSANMGHAGDFSQPKFIEALKSVVEACDRHGKTAGILTRSCFESQHAELGFRFVASGSDQSCVANGLQLELAKLKSCIKLQS